MSPEERAAVHPDREPVTWGHLTRELVHLREMIVAAEGATQRALDLQAKEYERRLDTLTHAHTESLDNWRRTLPRETFEAFKAEHDRERAKVAIDLERSRLLVERTADDLRAATEKRAAELREADERIADRMRRMILSVGVAVSALSAAVQIFLGSRR